MQIQCNFNTHPLSKLPQPNYPIFHQIITPTLKFEAPLPTPACRAGSRRVHDGGWGAIQTGNQESTKASLFTNDVGNTCFFPAKKKCLWLHNFFVSSFRRQKPKHVRWVFGRKTKVEVYTSNQNNTQVDSFGWIFLLLLEAFQKVSQKFHGSWHVVHGRLRILHVKVCLSHLNGWYTVFLFWGR